MKTLYEILENKIRHLDDAMKRCIDANRWPMALIWCIKIQELEAKQGKLTVEEAGRMVV